MATTIETSDKRKSTPTIVDTYRVLPHRDVLDCTLYSARTGEPVDDYAYEHVPCGRPLSRRDVVEENWCGHCVGYINKAAKRRAEQHRREG